VNGDKRCWHTDGFKAKINKIIIFETDGCANTCRIGSGIGVYGIDRITDWVCITGIYPIVSTVDMIS